MAGNHPECFECERLTDYVHLMSTVPFDTLKFSERLQGHGFSADQAKGLAEELASYGSASLASKTDLELALSPVRADLALLKYGVAALTALNTGILVKLLVS